MEFSAQKLQDLYKYSHTVLKKEMLLNIFWASYFYEVKEIKQLNKEIL